MSAKCPAACLVCGVERLRSGGVGSEGQVVERARDWCSWDYFDGADV